MISPGLLKDIGLFSGLSDEEIAMIAALCEERTYQTGAYVFAEGAEADRIYFLEYGRVVLEATPGLERRDRRNAVVVDVVARGETFGFSALVPPRFYSSSARCLSPVKVYAAGGQALAALFEHECRLGYRVLLNLSQVVSERLRDTRQLLANERLSPD